MGRQDYDEVKQKYEAFVAVWKSKKVDQLDTIIDKEALCYISTVKAYPCGSQHSLFGIKDFICDMPTCDRFHTCICNYHCRLNGDMAYQVAHVVDTAAKYQDKSDDLQIFEFTAMMADCWRKRKKGGR